jgi:hypothetical protein
METGRWTGRAVDEPNSAGLPRPTHITSPCVGIVEVKMTTTGIFQLREPWNQLRGRCKNP